jgi:hypothetical protein
MKKLFFVVVLVVLAASFALAQGTATPVGTQGGTAGATYSGNAIGVLNYVPNYDVMGAHENGGRGCAGCHAPHNGAKGNGGTAAGYGSYASAQGGLWGEDTSLIMSNYSSGITFNGGLSHHSGKLTWGTAALSPTTAWSDSTYTGVATCLSCHDGAVSSGAMLSGVAYEQAFGLLNGTFAANTSFNSNRNAGLSTALYGPNPIPTFLGGTTGQGYNYQHPVGQNANLGAVLGSVLTNSAYGLSVGVNGNAISVKALTANTPYANFVATYYPGAMLATVAQSGNAGDNFVVCTTCHNQHNMAVYGGGQRNESMPAGVTQVRTIFFVNGGYNPGAPYDPTHEPSTMRFCQQCHFSFSSEYYGATNVGTAY